MNEIDIKDLKKIRLFFALNDESTFEHWAFAFLDDLIKKHEAQILKEGQEKQ